MKKHDEGYVLVYVTVVLLVFCLVATTILTGAMRNLEHQQAANQQMKDQYVAAGMIEKVLADWEDNQTETNLYGVTIERIETQYTLTATSGTVTIVCKVDGNGNYISYDVGTVESTPNESGVVPE